MRDQIKGGVPTCCALGHVYSYILGLYGYCPYADRQYSKQVLQDTDFPSLHEHGMDVMACFFHVYSTEQKSEIIAALDFRLLKNYLFAVLYPMVCRKSRIFSPNCSVSVRESHVSTATQPGGLQGRGQSCQYAWPDYLRNSGVPY